MYLFSVNLKEIKLTEEINLNIVVGMNARNFLSLKNTLHIVFNWLFLYLVEVVLGTHKIELKISFFNYFCYTARIIRQHGSTDIIFSVPCDVG